MMANYLRAFLFVGLVLLNMKQILAQSTCYFSFGDSLVDNGNNNNLNTLAKANYPPYGVDFQGGVATGRFTNNRTLADFVAQRLGLANFIPPFATARGRDIENGVNYGSGAAGIRDETGYILGDRISFNRQLINHKITISRLPFLLGGIRATRQYLNQCLYTIVLGSNDYLNNYFLPQYYLTSTIYTPDEYAAALIQQLKQQLQVLHGLGARKVAIFGLSALGCVLQEINTYNTTGCVGFINDAVELFNNRLRPLVDSLNAQFPDSKFIYTNSTSIQSGPTPPGLVLDRPCCPVSEIGQCIPGSTPCSNRAAYVSFDNFHPTDGVSQAYVDRSFDPILPTDAYPFGITALLSS
ncbi:OLC1v1022063C1 [Oldenlandia corymbosa var. corymbosa]|uniref:OLC1v1022063C1 n=1 Tax=Oldenlandia corymbosa var. corymbosa TaxID=529605 RepID=A0AAV1BXM7_OLDCO|nr:OLC1v1022063C1 [Oldenlandia corymbosa var. corymbosa]